MEEPMSEDQQMKEIMVLADIRQAIGDNGKMMQDELVDYIKNLQELRFAAERVVDNQFFKPTCMGLEAAVKKIRSS